MARSARRFWPPGSSRPRRSAGSPQRSSRRLLPGILVVPLVIGWFARQAEVQAYYDSAATLAIFAVANVVVLVLFAWATIGAVRRADRDRQVALIDLRGQREWLSTTLGSIGEGVIATDPNGSVLLLNKVAEEPVS